MQRQKALTLMYSSVSRSSSVLSRVVMRWTFLSSPSFNTKRQILNFTTCWKGWSWQHVCVCTLLGGHTLVLWALQADFPQKSVGRHIKRAHFQLRAQPLDFQTKDRDLRALWKAAQLDGQLEKRGNNSPLKNDKKIPPYMYMGVIFLM